MSRRAWLTPDLEQLTMAQDCRKIAIPAPLWLYVNGALELLTKDYNWEEFGDASIEETTQFFMSVIDAFAVSRCGMKWYLPNGLVLFNETYTMVSGYEITITKAGLPDIVQDATGLLVRVNVRTSNSAGKSLIVTTGANTLGQIFRIPTQSSDYYFTVVCPIEDGLKFLTNETNGNSVTWQAILQGWW